MRMYKTCVALVVTIMALSAVGASVAAGQHMGGQQPMMQGHMGEMQDMMERMGRIMDRSHQMTMGMGPQGGPMAHQQQMLQQMDTSMGAMAEQMKAMMGQAQLLMRDQTLMRDRGMQRDMTQLQQHMGAMTG